MVVVSEEFHKWNPRLIRIASLDCCLMRLLSCLRTSSRLLPPWRCFINCAAHRGCLKIGKGGGGRRLLLISRKQLNKIFIFLFLCVYELMKEAESIYIYIYINTREGLRLMHNRQICRKYTNFYGIHKYLLNYSFQRFFFFFFLSYYVK